jgi:ectoine hydroxylase-related dioxygenase (phytanoyl-CoA dioxygenase family)
MESDSDSGAQRQALLAAGAATLERAFDASLVDQLREAFLARHALPPHGREAESCLEVGHRRFMFSVGLGRRFFDERLYANPTVLGLVRDALGPDCVVQAMGVVCAYPGADAQHVHRDTPELFPDQPGLDGFLPAYAVTMFMPLVALDETSGTTCYWRGTHRGIGDEGLRAGDAHALPAGIGDGYLMDVRVRHFGMPNLSAAPRPIVYVVYSRPWYSDAVNYSRQPPLALPSGWESCVRPEHAALFAAASARQREVR